MENFFVIIKAFSPGLAAFFISYYILSTPMHWILKGIIVFGIIAIFLIYTFHPDRPHDEE